jgi:hypothetical protein
MIRVRVSAEELARMQDLAKARGLSVSDLIRRAALGVRMPARGFDQTHAAVLARTLAELGRIGGNVNQLARRANVGRLAGHNRELGDALAGIDALRARIRDMLA